MLDLIYLLGYYPIELQLSALSQLLSFEGDRKHLDSFSCALMQDSPLIKWNSLV